MKKIVKLTDDIGLTLKVKPRWEFIGQESDSKSIFIGNVKIVEYRCDLLAEDGIYKVIKYTSAMPNTIGSYSTVDQAEIVCINVLNMYLAKLGV